MNKKVLTIILLIAFIALLIGATLWYNSLSKDYEEAPPAPNEAGEESSAEPAPDFTVYDTEGNELKLSDMKGKPVVVNFWASWCGPCKMELPAFESMYNEYGDEIEFMMVNLTGGRETVETVQDFLELSGFVFPVYYDLDMSAAASYNIRSIPLSVFINSDGELVNSHMGAMNEDTLKAYIDEIIPAA